MTTNTTRSTLAIALQSYLDSLEEEKFVAAESFATEIANAAALAAAEAATLYIVFYYDLTEIKDEVFMLSHYKAKNIKTQDKEPKDRLDELTITEDEDEILMKLLSDAARDVYKIIAPYGKNITGGYLFNPDVTEPVEYDDGKVYNEGDLFYVEDQLYRAIADETPAGTDPIDTDYFTAVAEYYNTYNKIVFTLNYNSNMDPSMINVMNDDLEDCLIKHTLFGWYKLTQEIAMATLSKDEYEDSKSKVLHSLWYEITPTRRRSELF
jgi:hypothetical protein